MMASASASRSVYSASSCFLQLGDLLKVGVGAERGDLIGQLARLRGNIGVVKRQQDLLDAAVALEVVDDGLAAGEGEFIFLDRAGEALRLVGEQLVVPLLNLLVGGGDGR